MTPRRWLVVIVALILVLVLAATAAAGCGRGADPPAAAPPPAPAERAEPAPRVLRVCADPNNLPFSNARGEGFENRIAELVAAELGAELAYEWKPWRRGFLRTGVNAGACDVVIGIAAGVELALTTRPYYRSSYAIVQRRDAPRRVTSLDDPALASLRIGVSIIGDDYANAPPAHALARRGLAANLVGYTIYGDYREDSPPGDVVRAVARGEVDVAIAWGPTAGWFAARSAVPLEVVPVDEAADGALPMQFDIAMAVGRRDRALRDELDRVIEARRDDLAAILRAHGVPGG